MTFEQKKELVEAERAKSIEFDDYFKELLSSGLSSVGAYNMCHQKLVEKKPAPEVKKPVPTSKKPTNATAKVEKANEQPSKSK